MSVRRIGLATELLTLLAFCAFLFFNRLGSFGLVGADEPRYAQIAREMLARHDWVTPVLNGVAWLEKPVLYYWGAMISYRLFGVHDWAARVPTAVMATAMVLATYWFMRRFRPGSQLDTGLILGSLAGIIGFARAASTDMPLTAMFAIGMLAWYAWHETQQKLWLCAFYVFIALGMLAKGPVAPFLAGFVIVVFVAIRRDWKLIPRTLWIPGIILFLAVALPWYVLVQRANPQFLHVFIFEHNLERYSTNMFRHKQPFWYFGPVLLAGLVPWVVFAVAAFVRAAKEYKTGSFELFFGLWAILPVIFFSFSESKLPGYILPSIPAFGILTGHYLWRRINEGNEPQLWLSAIHSVVGGILLGAALLTVYFVLGLKPTVTAGAIAAIAGFVTFLGMLAAIYARGLRMVRLATLAPVVIALGFVIKFASPAIDLRDSSRPIARELSNLPEAQITHKVAVYKTPREIEYGLNFYENERIANYDRGEIPAEPHFLVAKAGSGNDLRMMLGKRVMQVGEYPSRKLDFYFISAR